MKATHEPSSRVIKVTEIPQLHPDDLAELEILVNYTGEGSGLKAVPLDSQIIPRIVAALNTADPRLDDIRRKAREIEEAVEGHGGIIWTTATQIVQIVDEMKS